MKEAIHPDYHFISVVQTDGTEYRMRTTWGKDGDVLRLDIDPLSHPAWKGGPAKVMDKGQLSKFEKKFGSFMTTTGVKTKGDEKADDSK